MADPTRYIPGFNYSGWEADHPTEPKPGAELDNDFAHIRHSIDETIDALKDLRRSDGKLNNGIVDKDALDESARELWESAEVAAENAKGSAQSAAGSAQSAADSAQSAGESAEAARGYASDAVSQGNVPIYSSAVGVADLKIPPPIMAIRTNGYYVPGDGGGALYVEGDEEPGAIQSGDGRWWRLSNPVLNALQFGVKADYNPDTKTGTDNTDKFNALFNLLRSSTFNSNPDVTTRSVVIPPGNYLVTSVNVTNIRATARFGQGVWIQGHGARLYSRTPGAVVFDATESMGLLVEGISIIGDDDAPPKIGIQIARSTLGFSADRHKFQSVLVSGSFSLACYYNFASEREHVTDCQFSNNHPSPSSYCYVLDGLNWFEASSQYIDIEQTKYTPQSNLSHYFEQTTFTKSPGTSGSPIWLSRFGRLRMVNCYAVTRDDYGVVIETDSFPIEEMFLDLHVETSPMLGLVRFKPLDPDNINTQRKITVNHLTLLENSMHGSDAVFRTSDASDTIQLNEAVVHISGERPNVHGVYRLFAPTEAFVVNGGKILTPRGSDDFLYPEGNYLISLREEMFEKGSPKSTATVDDVVHSSSFPTRSRSYQENGTYVWEGFDIGQAFKIRYAGTDKLVLRVTGNGDRAAFVKDPGTEDENQIFVFTPGGSVVLPRLSTAPSNPVGGEVYYDISTHKLRVFVGGDTSAWVDLN